MKKIFKISLVAVLAATPLMAFSAPVAGEPTAGDTDSPTATNAPKYGLRAADDNDVKSVTAGYVKGAYNAVIKGINKTHDEIGTLNTNIDTFADTVDGLLNGKATQTGTVKTIKAATTTETIDSSSVNITGVTTSDISATASGNVNLSMSVKDDWEADTSATNPIQITTSFSNLNVDDIAMAAPSANTATLEKSGIGGTVNVAEYLAQAQAQAQAAAQPYNYTPLIDYANGFDYKSADGSNSSDDADGLSNGEWKVVWNSYGTAKGTSMCSETGNGYDESEEEEMRGKTGTPSSTVGGACWCKMTSFTETNGTLHNDTSLWVFVGGYGDGNTSECASGCADYCGSNIQSNSTMQSGVFNSIQQ